MTFAKFNIKHGSYSQRHLHVGPLRIYRKRCSRAFRHEFDQVIFTWIYL